MCALSLSPDSGLCRAPGRMLVSQRRRHKMSCPGYGWWCRWCNCSVRERKTRVSRGRSAHEETLGQEVKKTWPVVYSLINDDDHFFQKLKAEQLHLSYSCVNCILSNWYRIILLWNGLPGSSCWLVPRLWTRPRIENFVIDTVGKCCWNEDIDVFWSSHQTMARWNVSKEAWMTQMCQNPTFTFDMRRWKNWTVDPMDEVLGLIDNYFRRQPIKVKNSGKDWSLRNLEVLFGTQHLKASITVPLHRQELIPKKLRCSWI